ncbi:MAG: glycerol kinase, partial [Deltaproteobacteria bacterium]
MTDYIGAVDLGTTSNRFIIFDQKGQIVGLSQKEHRQIFPKPGWVEHDPMEIWLNTQEVMKEALIRAKVSGNEIVAIGITNQRETTVVWDRKTGKPYHHAIVWQCTRTDKICRELESSEGQNRFREKTGL